jgi:hypothetical protein
MRDGVPLPGTTAAAVLSQLAHRVFGPIRMDRVRTMLDYHGLAGHPANSTAVIAAQHGISAPTVNCWAETLRAAGSRLPLSVDLATEICRGTRHGEDHLARTRAAKTLGLLPPNRPVGPVKAPSAALPPADRAAGLIAARVLATAGPQPLEVLQTAVERARRFRPRSRTTTPLLAAALHALGATTDDHERWHPPPDLPVPVQYRALVDAVDQRTLTRNPMKAALVAAGYRTTYAERRAIDTHPLIRRVGPNAYRLIGAGP